VNFVDAEFEERLHIAFRVHAVLETLLRVVLSLVSGFALIHFLYKWSQYVGEVRRNCVAHHPADDEMDGLVEDVCRSG